MFGLSAGEDNLAPQGGGDVNLIKWILAIPFFVVALSWGMPSAAVDVPSTFVSADWLRAHLGKPGLSVIEVSSAVSYEFDGHVPGASMTTKGEWRVGEEDGAFVHRPVDQLQSMIRALGVNDGDGVVIYGKGDTLDEVLGSAYLLWLFHYLGHDNVALLDEGWSGWLAAEAPVETDTADISLGTFKPRVQERLQFLTDEALALYQSVPVVDGRPASHFSGADKFPANTRFGRIPGSLNQSWGDYIAKDMDGRIYMTSSLPVLLKGTSLQPDQEILLTCFGGTGAAMNFVLFYHHGFKRLRVHDDGILRWNLRNLPLARD